MTEADDQYLDLAKHILNRGYYDNNRTGIPTYKSFGEDFRFDLKKEFPILTSKFVAFQDLKKELFWIYVYQSNDIRFLKDVLKCKVWNEWMLPDGTCGLAYGYQVKKYKQIDTLIHTLKTNPQDRGMIINLWNVEDLPFMALRPCAFQTMWDVTDGRLNCTLVQRSADMGLGVPYNMTQYALLIHMIAHVTGLEVGEFVHYMNNAHIYENHVKGIRKQLDSYTSEYAAPKIWLNPEITNFYDFKLDDIQLVNNRFSKDEIKSMSKKDALNNIAYNKDRGHHGKINMGEVAV